MSKTTIPLLVEDFYETTLTEDVNSSGNIELKVSTPPINKKGFIIVDPESIANRERMYYHDVIGNIIYVKGVNRVDPKAHSALDKVQINDTSLIFNYLSRLQSTTFFIEQLSSLGIKVLGGPVLMGIVTVSVVDTELTMINSATNFIYYKASTNEIKTAISEVTATNDKGVVVAEVITASGIITSINYRHHKLVAGNSIDTITLTNTTGLIDTYTILFTDGTTTSFQIKNGSSIASIDYTSSSGLVDTYTVTLTNGATDTFEVTNGSSIANINYTSTLGLVDTYTVTLTNGTTDTFEVTNGRGITDIEKTLTVGSVDTYTITYNDNTTSTFNITNGEVTVKQIQEQSHIYKTSTGTANNYLLAIDGITAYVAGLKVAFKANFENTGNSTLNINGLGAKTLKKLSGTTNLAAGDIQNGQIIEATYDGTNFQVGIISSPNPSILQLLGVFGDGGDGDVIINSGVVTLSRDMHYNNLTLNSPGTINSNGYKIYVKGIFSGNGSILQVGNNGSNGTSATGGTVAGGVGGLALNQGSLGANVGGANGGSSTSDSAGVSGSNGVSSNPTYLLSNGVNGGNGGGNDQGTSGGTGGTGGTSTRGVLYNKYYRLTDFLHPASIVNIVVNQYKTTSGAGGGGGGAGRLYTGGSGGGGGGAGGIIFISAFIFNFSGILNVTGGNGGNGGNPSLNLPGNGGGGGGGNGGLLYLIYNTKINLGTHQLSGGNGGNAGTGGIGGVAGQNGANGVLIEIPLY